MKKITTKIKAVYILGALTIISICKANSKPDITIQATETIRELKFLPLHPNTLAILSGDFKIYFQNTATGKSSTKSFESILQFALNTDGTKLAFLKNTCHTPYFEIWDISDTNRPPILHKKIFRSPPSPKIRVLAFAQNNTKLITTDLSGENIILLDIETGKQINKPIKLKHDAIAFNPSNNILASLHTKEQKIKIHILSLEKHQVTPTNQEISLKDNPHSPLSNKSLKFNTTGTKLGFVAPRLKNYEVGLLSIYSLNSEKPAKKISQNFFNKFAFGQHNGKKVVATVDYDRIHLWYQDMLTLKELVVQFILKNNINTKNIPPLLLKI